MIVAGVIGKPAEEQIAALKNLAPNFHFGIDLARLLTPPTTEDLRIHSRFACQGTRRTCDIGMAGLSQLLKNAADAIKRDVLLSLVTHTNENIRGAAIQLIVQADDVSLGAAFVDSGWSHIKGQSSQEASTGSYLIAKYGTHLEFDVARKRITPQGLAILVEKRGMRDDEIHVLFAYTAELLDEKVSEKESNATAMAVRSTRRMPGGKWFFSMMGHHREVAPRGYRRKTGRFLRHFSSGRCYGGDHGAAPRRRRGNMDPCEKRTPARVDQYRRLQLPSIPWSRSRENR